MKNEDEFLKTMENLQVPEVNPQHQNTVKMAIMNAERSAALGVWLIVVPCYFLFCVLMYYYFHARMGWFGAMFNLIAGLNKVPGIDFMAPLVLVVLPIVCVVINTLSIVHVQVIKHSAHQSKAKEFTITVKPRLWNILLILISIAILCVFISFVMTQNISIKN